MGKNNALNKLEKDPLTIEKDKMFKEVLQILGAKNQEQRFELLQQYGNDPRNSNKKLNGSRSVTQSDINMLVEIIKNDKENHYRDKIESYFKKQDLNYRYSTYQEMLSSLLRYPLKEHKHLYKIEIETNLKGVDPLFIYKLFFYYKIFNSSIFVIFERYCELNEKEKTNLITLLHSVKLNPFEFLTVDKDTRNLITKFIFDEDIKEKFNQMDKKQKKSILKQFTDKLSRNEKDLEILWLLSGYFRDMDEDDWKAVVGCFICVNHNEDVYECLFKRKPYNLELQNKYRNVHNI